MQYKKYERMEDQYGLPYLMIQQNLIYSIDRSISNKKKK